jgi:hypothetical protein
MTTTLAYAWSCLGDGHDPCDAAGEGPDSDRQAEKHCRAHGHATTTHRRQT